MRSWLTLSHTFVLSLFILGLNAGAADFVQPPESVPYDRYIDHWARISKSVPPVGVPFPQSGLAIGGAELSSAKEIVVVTLNPNIGDNLINSFGQLQYLHEKNPQAVIKVISPTSRVLKESSWLKPIQIALDIPVSPAFEKDLPDGASKRSAALMKEKLLKNPRYWSQKLKDAVAPHLSKDAFYIFEEHTVDYLGEQILAELPLSAEEKPIKAAMEADFRELSAWMQVEIAQRKKGAVFLKEDDFVVMSNTGKPRTVVLSRKIEGSAFLEAGTNSRYEWAAIRTRLLLGPDVELSWPVDHYHDLAAHEDAFKKLLATSFKKPNEPFVILNMNTRNDLKILFSRDKYMNVYEAILADLKKKHPNVNIFIAPVEETFGSANAKAVAALVQKNKGRVALLPANNKPLWNSAAAEAVAVVSQDSGFVHMSNIFNDNVLSLTFNKRLGGQSWMGEGWVKSEENLIRVEHESFLKKTKIKNLNENESAVLAWLDKKITSVAPPAQSCLARFLKFFKPPN